MTLIAKPDNRTPANVEDSWQRLEHWLANAAPEILASLRPGCTDAQLGEFEEQVQLSLPEDVKNSFRIHDGQEEYTAAGAIVGEPLDSLANVCSGLAAYRQLYEDEQQSDHDSGLADRATSFPPGAIQCEYVTPNWIPLGDWDGNCYGIDLNPGPNGVMGQVINFGRDEDDKYVLALSWAHFLEDVVEELEAGNLSIKRTAEGEVEHFGRAGRFDQALFSLYKERSEAKLPASFKSAQPVTPEKIIPGEVAQGDIAAQVRTLVEQFVQAMHAYEVRWLKVRPIHELGYSRITESSSGYSTYGLQSASRRAAVDELKIHEFTTRAVREKKSIFKQFATPRKRVMADAFVQVYPLAYDPKRDRIAEIRQVAPDYCIAYMQPVDDVTVRYHVALKDGRWLIDLKDRTIDHAKFEKRSL